MLLKVLYTSKHGRSRISGDTCGTLVALKTRIFHYKAIRSLTSEIVGLLCSRLVRISGNMILEMLFMLDG